MSGAKPVSVAYKRGTNERLDKIIGDSRVWIINGEMGRLPLEAETLEEALAEYDRRNKIRIEQLKLRDY